ncbi:hypothetical protein [Mariniluteicoccus flavus]
MQSWQWALLAVPAIVLLVSIVMIVRILTASRRAQAHGPVEPAPREEVPPVVDHERPADRADGDDRDDDRPSLFSRPDDEDDATETVPSAPNPEPAVAPASADSAEEVDAERALSGKNAVIEGSGARPRNAAE